MAAKNHQNSNVVSCLFFIIALSQIFSNIGYVEGIRVSSMEKVGLFKHHEENKTIVTKNGDIIDCVDIYKQPAFNHPLLWNHTIQMKPSSSLGNRVEARSSDYTIDELFQGWFKNQQCPEGTIPIVRSKMPNRRTHTTPPPFNSHNTHLDQNLVTTTNDQVHEYAIVDLDDGGKYYGARARINVWNPRTNPGEISLAQLWVVGGQNDDTNTLEAGWQALSEDKEPRLFIYWTKDNYKNTGCYNLQCPGFVQVNNKITIGGILSPVSIYGGEQRDITISIRKDDKGNWWFNMQNQDVGYWPGSLLTTLAESSSLISWGGEITNSKPNGKHTSTQMGSGHFPNEGFDKASFIANLQYQDNTGSFIDPKNIKPQATNPGCYDILVKETSNDYGVHFYYGGPGLSAQCP